MRFLKTVSVSLFFICLFFAGATTASAATRTISDSGGNWNDPATWVEGEIPTSSDDVVATATSGDLTINIAAAARSVNLTDYTGTLTHNAGITLSIGSSTPGPDNVALYFPTDGWTYTVGSTMSQIHFVSTSVTQQTITTGSKTIGSITFNGSGSYQLQDDIVLSGNFVYEDGSSFDTNEKSITLTDGGTFNGGGQTYDEVILNGSSVIVSGTNTFGNLTRNGGDVRTAAISFSADQTIMGTLTLSGDSSINRLIVRSSTIGTPVTLTAGAVEASNVDFRDIVGAGDADWDLSEISGLSGDAGGNSGITLTDPATQTWQGTNGGNWSDSSKWTSRVPLPQDDVIVNVTFSASQTIQADMPRLGKTIDFTGTGGNPTFNLSSTSAPEVYGSLILVPEMNVTMPSSSLGFYGRDSYTFASQGKTFSSIVVNMPEGTLTLDGDLTVGTTNTFTLNYGTFTTGSYNFTTGNFASTQAGTRHIDFGTGIWTITGDTGNVWNTATSNSLTITRGNNVRVTGTGNRNILSASSVGLEANSIDFSFIGSSGTITLSNNSRLHNLDMSQFSGTFTIGSNNIIYGDLIVGETTTVSSSNNTLTFGASSDTQRITTNNVTLDFPVTFAGISGTFELQDDFTLGATRALTFSMGNFNANDKNITVGNVVSTSTTARTLTMGSGTWELTGETGIIWNMTTSDTVEVIPGTSKIILSGTLTATRSFAGGNKTYYDFENATIGNYALVITGSNTFNYFKINPGRIQRFTNGTTTTVTNFDAIGTEEDPIVINSSPISPSTHNLVKVGGGIVSADWLNISNSSASPANTWYAGVNSINTTNNSGWIFSNPSVVPNIPTDLEVANLMADEYVNSPTPEFSFSVSDDDEEDELRYHFQLATDNDFESLVTDYISELGEQGERSYQTGQNTGEYLVGEEGQELDEGTYYWRVSAIDEHELEGDWAVGISFTVDFTPPSAPGVPTTDSPTTSTTQEWVWEEATDAISGIAYYAWRVINAATFDPVTNGITNSLSAVTDLGVGIYNFYVKAFDNAGNEGEESEGELTVVSPLSPTPTSLPTNNNSNASSSAPSAPSCGDSQPAGTPDLFQIDVNSTQATLYFTPVSDADRYYISYGNGTGTGQYGIEFTTGATSGVISYTVNALSSNTQYSFVVRGGNGCQPGGWSNTLTIKTGSSVNSGTSYFKDFASRVLSVFPRAVTNAGSGSNVLGAKTVTPSVKGCHDYTVRSGESLWNIAAEQLGSGSKYTEIMQSNNLSSTLLRTGQTLKIDC